ncbi:MAG: DNA-binding protein [Clostridiaceae bacterium]|nr:DNA-binding protein [Clostridiaceae bacterium]
MEYRVFADVLIARIDKGEEIVASIKNICAKEKILLGKINAIGAVKKARIGLFETGTKRYISTELNGDFEIVSLSGTVTGMNGEPYLHLHVNLADSSFKTYGGHLNEAYVSATCELTLQIIKEGSVGRKFSEEIGLNLMEF